MTPPNGFYITNLLLDIEHVYPLERPDIPISLHADADTSLIIKADGNLTSIVHPGYSTFCKVISKLKLLYSNTLVSEWEYAFIIIDPVEPATINPVVIVSIGYCESYVVISND